MFLCSKFQKESRIESSPVQEIVLTDISPSLSLIFSLDLLLTHSPSLSLAVWEGNTRNNNSRVFCICCLKNLYWMYSAINLNPAIVWFLSIVPKELYSDWSLKITKLMNFVKAICGKMASALNDAGRGNNLNE